LFLIVVQGDGSAPLQPQEVTDASDRLAFLALTNPNLRPVQDITPSPNNNNNHRADRQALMKYSSSDAFRYYDAVGPETMSILEMLRIFARAQGNDNFHPVFIGYRNMEKLLNVRSLGNLNRQFVSLLRSEQDASNPVIGDSTVWEKVLGDEAKLLTLGQAFEGNEERLKDRKARMFPYWNTFQLVMKNPRVITPGIQLSFEIIGSYFRELTGGSSYYSSAASVSATANTHTSVKNVKV
jgi:hypothetical protein